jgi:CheY-like chemotaxis protein
VRTAAYRGVSLVKQLLTFARKNEVDFRSVFINNIIKEVATLLKETLPKTITISMNLADDLPAISADATQIHQVLLNLSVNARDAMPKGGTLSIASERVNGGSLTARFPNADALSYAVIRVADTGEGMDEETKKKIFEPFFTTKGPGIGTGLGLALVYGIVKTHQGMIEVETGHNTGTTFTLYFPAEVFAVETADKEEESIRDIKGGRETILLIEDEKPLCDYIKSVLEAKGYGVLTAEDGEEGLNLFQREPAIDLIISDIGMPKVDGTQVFKRIKADRPGVKVILISGLVDPGVRSRMASEGARYFISKPFSPETVLKTVRQALDGKE